MAQPWAGMDAGERPPGHHLVFSGHDPVDGDLRRIDRPAKAFEMGDEPVASRRAAKGAVGLVHHVGLGDLGDQLQPAGGDDVTQVGFRQVSWRADHPRHARGQMRCGQWW